MASLTTLKCPGQPLTRPARETSGCQKWAFFVQTASQDTSKGNGTICSTLEGVIQEYLGEKTTHQINRQVNQLDCVHIISSNTHVTHFF